MSEEQTSRRVGRRREDRLVGASTATQRLIDQASAAARSDLAVLISGPSGAGKQFIARSIHAWSDRASEQLEAVACDALLRGLQMRELFGCATGTHPALPAAYEGALSRAAGGTLLLVAIDQLEPSVLEAVVDAISERSFHREGESTRLPLRARVILTAENPPERLLRDLPHHALRLPPLVERKDDILPLAAHFLGIFAEEAGIRPVGFTPDARDHLLGEPWHGNVRELRERIRQAVLLARDGAISAEALLLASEASEIPSFKEAKRAFETRYVTGLLRRCQGNISRAARLAKKDRKDFYDVIRRTGIDPSQFR